MSLDKAPLGSLDDVARSLLGIDGGYTDTTAETSFGTARIPDANNPTLVLVAVHIRSTGGSTAQVDIDVDGTKRAESTVTATAGALTSAPDVQTTETVSLIVGAGSSFTIRNTADPNGTNSIASVHELTL